MADLVFNAPGRYTDYFIVSVDGAPYQLPERGADFAVRLRGRVPTRYEQGGMEATFAVGSDEEGTVIVESFVPWDERRDAGAMTQFEGWVRTGEGDLHASGALVFDSVDMPRGLGALLNYEGLGAAKRRELMLRSSPPLGTLRTW